jgi:two-component system chemotaxis response regulator CheV
VAKKEKQEILLESGTNEIEIMEFTIGGNIFGINVAKVKEIIMPCPIKPMPNSHPAVEGVIKPRDLVITLIDLPKYLNLEPSPEGARNLFIVTNFNQINIAFRVHHVVGIDRISWSAIEKPDRTIYGGKDGVATGLAQCEDRLITVLDFEKIVADISPETSIQISEIEKLGERKQSEQPILVAEDSVLLEKLIIESLKKAGYSNVIECHNGQEAWDYISHLPKEGDVLEKVSCIITDLEMPKMDGHRLTKLVKSDPYYKQIPLIIFSSLINPEMHIKGKQLGADEQLSKPEIGHLVEVIDRLIEKTQHGAASNNI